MFRGSVKGTGTPFASFPFTSPAASPCAITIQLESTSLLIVNERVHLNRSWASVQSTTGSRGVRIRDNNAGYIMFRGSAKGTGYPLHSPVFPSLPHRASPCAITFQRESNSGCHGNQSLAYLFCIS